VFVSVSLSRRRFRESESYSLVQCFFESNSSLLCSLTTFQIKQPRGGAPSVWNSIPSLRVNVNGAPCFEEPVVPVVYHYVDLGRLETGQSLC
jgi:hypothetical protein